MDVIDTSSPEVEVVADAPERNDRGPRRGNRPPREDRATDTRSAEPRRDDRNTENRQTENRQSENRRDDHRHNDARHTDSRRDDHRHSEPRRDDRGGERRYQHYDRGPSVLGMGDHVPEFITRSFKIETMISDGSDEAPSVEALADAIAESHSDAPVES
jgi:hypothetical protein